MTNTTPDSISNHAEVTAARQFVRRVGFNGGELQVPRGPALREGGAAPELIACVWIAFGGAEGHVVSTLWAG